jgi:type I restriction enzyme S subunit
MAEIQLAKAPKRRRLRVYPAYKPSGIEWLGDIPVHWSLAPVYARYEVALGKMLDAKRVKGEYSGRYIRNVDVQWDAVSTEGLPVMDFAPWERERYLLRPGDLLICEGGEVGRTAIWNGEIDECFYQKAIHRVRPRSNDDLPRFFYYLMYMLAKRGVFVASGNSNTIDHLTAVQLRHYRIPLCSPPEQGAIAAFLDRETARTDKLVARKERLIELLQEQRTALITSAVTKGLDTTVPMKDSGVEWLGEIPTHWDLKALKHYLRAPLAYGVLKPDKYSGDDGVRLIRILDVESGHVSEDALELISPEQSTEFRRTVVRAGDLVLSVVGTIGRAFVVPRSLEGANLSRALARIQLKASLSARFLEYQFEATSFASFVELVPAGTAQRVLNLGDLAEYWLPVPPIPQQEAITAFLHEETARLDALIAKVREAIERLKEFRTALISAAVTGKIDVRESA